MDFPGGGGGSGSTAMATSPPSKSPRAAYISIRGTYVRTEKFVREREAKRALESIGLEDFDGQLWLVCPVVAMIHDFAVTDNWVSLPPLACVGVRLLTTSLLAHIPRDPSDVSSRGGGRRRVADGVGEQLCDLELPVRLRHISEPGPGCRSRSAQPAVGAVYGHRAAPTVR